MTEPPPELKHLNAKFEQNIESYRNPAYGEAEVRIEFINPLFELLGWDVSNKSGHAEAYKDLIHEDAIKVGGSTKAPDYSFRIGGVRKFFLEAKKLRKCQAEVRWPQSEISRMQSDRALGLLKISAKQHMERLVAEK
jgi:hypothetical protein